MGIRPSNFVPSFAVAASFPRGGISRVLLGNLKRLDWEMIFDWNAASPFFMVGAMFLALGAYFEIKTRRLKW
jgi:hypothetical protein